jgi:hypothetical protein
VVHADRFVGGQDGAERVQQPEGRTVITTATAAVTRPVSW